MKNKMLILLCVVICSCSTNTHNSKNFDKRPDEKSESLEKVEEAFSDVKNCFKQWNADNPRRPDVDFLNEIDTEPGPESQKAYKEYVQKNYGKEHSRTAIVRMYDRCPQLQDGTYINGDETSTMIIKTGNFVVYSVWRGPVVAKNLKNNYWFVVWDDNYNYNTKYIKSDGDGLITMEYIDTSDLEDKTNVIYYNLYTHVYYFAKEKYTGSLWP